MIQVTGKVEAVVPGIETIEIKVAGYGLSGWLSFQGSTAEKAKVGDKATITIAPEKEPCPT